MESSVDASGSLSPAPTAPVAPRQVGIWGGLGAVVLYFALQFAVALLCGLVIGSGYGFWKAFQSGLHHHRPDPDAIARSVQGNPDIKVILAIVSLSGAAFLMMWVTRRIWPALWSVAEPPGFGFVRPKRKIHLLYGALAGLAALVVGSGLTALFTHGNPFLQDVRTLANSASPALRMLLLAVTVCVIPPVEELVFRGALLSGLMRRMSPAWAILASAIIFGCVHLPDFKFLWYPVPALVLLGVLLAWLRLRTRSLWPCIAAHATNNFVAVLIWLAAAHLHA
jgi:membrane protease YdiL (CAAX protease family)